jgi:hypothetical protein
MSQTIHCTSCNTDSVARGVKDLIEHHTNEHGRFCCARCGGTETYLDVARGRGPRHAVDTWFRGIVPIETKTRDAAYAPFVFLLADEPDGEISGIAFKYYRPTATNGGRAKGGNGAGRGPALTQSQVLALVARLAKIGVVSRKDWRAFIHNNDARAG